MLSQHALENLIDPLSVPPCSEISAGSLRGLPAAAGPAVVGAGLRRVGAVDRPGRRQPHQNSAQTRRRPHGYRDAGERRGGRDVLKETEGIEWIRASRAEFSELFQGRERMF